MNVAIVTNQNGIGLQRDAELLQGVLAEWNHSTELVQWDVPYRGNGKFDLVIFCEVLPQHLLSLSERRWIFVNPEWCASDKQQLIGEYCEKVFAKTREAERIFSPLFPGRVHYTGFLARDQYNPEVARHPRFLHIGGKSTLRGTQAVVDAWRWIHKGKSLEAQLTVISSLVDKENLPANVAVRENVDEDELKRLQNSHFFHLMPSATEGFGHALHEAQGVDALLITTGHPPMCELEKAYFIPASRKGQFGLADIHEVSALTIHQAVTDVLKFWPDILWRGEVERPRKCFLRDNENFKTEFAKHFEEERLVATPLYSPGLPTLPVRDANILRIAFLGNFGASESTENMVRWALEEGLGYEVERLQENDTTLEQLQDARETADIFLWVRTPGWLRVSDQHMSDFLANLEIPSVALHLDLFWYIPERAELIGRIPFWNCDHVWTADGSRAKDFEARGVNHHWMKPAASEVYAHRGVRRAEYVSNVGFVGARTYHSEHPFRAELIDFLERTYGNGFKLVEGGLRGHALNDFYESCRVVVGDCFGGGKIPFYWSDRMIETPMRHGFLLSPMIPGLDVPLATFEPENLSELQGEINWWLAHEEKRRERITQCATHVLKHDSWTVRMREILETAVKK